VRRDLRAPAAATLAALLAGCHRPEAEPAPARRAVRCAEVRTIEVAEAIELRGTVSPLPDRDAQIAPQVAGRILQVLVREGDKVAAGQPVARIDDAALSDQAREAEAVLSKTRAERKYAEATLARTQRVFEHGIAARQEVDDATARADGARAAESEAEAAAQRARRQVERALVRSPLAGVVVRIARRTGELVDGTPATPVLEVADPARLELVSDAAASDLVRAQKGQPAEVTVAALPGARWAGAVSAVSPAVDRLTGLGTVRVALELGEGPRPPIGVLGTVRVTTGKPRPAPAVPKEALRNAVGAEAEVVLCGSDGAAHVRKIRRGAAVGPAGAAVEAAGLTAGQLVAVDPVIGLRDGDPIEVQR
jgi:RND family efflux transporter MFP subunit